MSATTICVKDIELRAAICKECGARIYPVGALKSHLEYHARKRQLLLKLAVAQDRKDESS
jgi:hypothetical protein